LISSVLGWASRLIVVVATLVKGRATFAGDFVLGVPMGAKLESITITGRVVFAVGGRLLKGSRTRSKSLASQMRNSSNVNMSGYQKYVHAPVQITDNLIEIKLIYTKQNREGLRHMLRKNTKNGTFVAVRRI